MKYGAIICTALFILGVALSLLQLWVGLLEPHMFLKLIVTIGAFFVVALAVTLVRRDYLSEKEMKKKGYLD